MSGISKVSPKIRSRSRNYCYFRFQGSECLCYILMTFTFPDLNRGLLRNKPIVTFLKLISNKGALFGDRIPHGELKSRNLRPDALIFSMI